MSTAEHESTRLKVQGWKEVNMCFLKMLLSPIIYSALIVAGYACWLIMICYFSYSHCGSVRYPKAA